MFALQDCTTFCIISVSSAVRIISHWARYEIILLTVFTLTLPLPSLSWISASVGYSNNNWRNSAGLHSVLSATEKAAVIFDWLVRDRERVCLCRTQHFKRCSSSSKNPESLYTPLSLLLFLLVTLVQHTPRVNQNKIQLKKTWIFTTKHTVLSHVQSALDM